MALSDVREICLGTLFTDGNFTVSVIPFVMQWECVMFRLYRRLALRMKTSCLIICQVNLRLPTELFRLQKG